MSFATKLLFQAKLANGGSLYNWELTDFPGVQVLDQKKDYKSKVQRTIGFGDQEFPTIAAAVDAWKKANPEVKKS